jgi:hypothetical protein
MPRIAMATFARTRVFLLLTCPASLTIAADQPYLPQAINSSTIPANGDLN